METTSEALTLHWRGVALADFDRTDLVESEDQFLCADQANSYLRSEDKRTSPASRPHPFVEHVIHYRVLMEPIGTNVFFLAPWARSISGDYRLVAGDSSGAVIRFRFTAPHRPLRGRLRHHADPARGAACRWPKLSSATCSLLALAAPRSARAAAGEKITSAATNDFDKAAAVENYLRTRFGYTLELPQTAVKDPIANFLFERKQGHCEYFASSMAVMLRSLGIPARVVNGFRSDEFNDLTGNYVVRAKNAHSWVEAYFPNYGWQTFDPTPAGYSGTPRAGAVSPSTSMPCRRSGATGSSATIALINTPSAKPPSVVLAACWRMPAGGLVTTMRLC